jgi:hypothetical protein
MNITAPSPSLSFERLLQHGPTEVEFERKDNPFKYLEVQAFLLRDCFHVAAEFDKPGGEYGDES